MILAIPSPLGVALGIATAAAYGIAAAASSRLARSSTRSILGIAWLLHACALGWGLVGGVPHFGFAPALSVTAWLVLTVYGIESRMYPQLKVRRMLALLGAGTALLAAQFPGTPLHVSASPWLPLHLALGIASYGLFGAAVVHAWLITRAEKQIRLAADPQSGVPLLTLERLTFRFVTAGFVLLSATLLAGLLFSETLYGASGRNWKWDHKSLFSVLAWITFAVLLIGRARFGWRGRTARRVLYAGSALLLLAYVGSRFVLEVVLGAHVVKYLLVLAVVFIGIWFWRKGRRDEMQERAASARASTPAIGAPEAMVRCAYCGLHLPATDAIGGPDGPYCSAAHRQASGH